MLFALIFIANSDSYAQSKKELEEKKKQLQKEISLTNKLLSETKKNKETSLDELVKLKSKITARQELISAINQNIRIVSKDISETQHSIAVLQADLERLKSEYAKMIYYAYKNRSNFDKIMFIFSSENFNQAYKRLKYIQQYSSFRKKQAETIIKTQTELKAKIEKLNQEKQEKSALLSLEEQEKQKLAVEKTEQEATVQKLQSKEQELKTNLRSKEESARKLQKAIEKIIEEEIRKAREAAEKANKGNKNPTTNTKTGFPLTPEALKLSNSFASNKGNLPWPVAEGIITDRFGQHPHPVLTGIEINNNGIDISTVNGAIARAIFDGEVSSVAIIPGGGKVVMIRHGEYLSVYSYLNEVYVKKGDKITTKQHIGTMVNESDKSKTNIHLEIWKGMTKLNPEYWIYRK